MNRLFLFLLTVGFWCAQTAVQAQETPQMTAEEQAAREAARRMRPTFFEEERQVKFGYADFLSTALDGNQNVFADPAKISGFRSDALSVAGQPINGVITIQTLNENRPGFLVTNFDSPNGSISFTNIQRQVDPRLGGATATGTITVNGQTFTFNNAPASYNAGYSENNVVASGVVLVTNSRDPKRSVFIQIPITNIEGYDEDNPFVAPATLTIGLPTDR